MEDTFVYRKKYNIHKSLRRLVSVTPPKADHRTKLTNMKLAFQAPVQGSPDDLVDYFKEEFVTKTGEKRTILRIRPKSARGATPGLVWFHGGGFLLKAAPHHYRLARQYAVETGCQVLMVDYRLMPEYSHPSQINDAFFAWNHITKNAEALLLDPDRIAIGGDGVGGSLAAGCCLKIRDEGWHRPCFQMLLYPILDFYTFGNSPKEYADSPVWNTEANKRMWDQYLYSGLVEGANYASPALPKSFRGFPPTYVEVVLGSCVLSEGINFAGNLEHLGGKYHVVRNAVHGFDAVADSPITIDCVSRRIAKLKEAFAK